ncbi:MAG: DUF3990 domain-containing protein [Candidatus Cryptobacteroides sp.]
MKNSYIQVYHGSIFRVESPLTHIGRQELDFGPGFYLTKSCQQATDWAKTKAGRKSGAKAILNVYEFDSEHFLASGTYQTLVFKDYNIQWLDFIAQSRKGHKPWAEYDYIEGGVANDSVITTVDAYIDGLITAEQAMGKLVNERLRNQICILNQEIIDKYLVFVESIEFPL